MTDETILFVRCLIYGSLWCGNLKCVLGFEACFTRGSLQCWWGQFIDHRVHFTLFILLTFAEVADTHQNQTSLQLTGDKLKSLLQLELFASTQGRFDLSRPPMPCVHSARALGFCWELQIYTTVLSTCEVSRFIVKT